jgi:PEP-CTERM motif
VPIAVALLAAPASADSFFFSTGEPDGKMATASRPGSTGKIEIESADDFALTSPTALTSATFTGLLPTGAPLSDVVDVRIEIYRVFSKDSDVGRTSGAPTFSTPNVPTRVNSPSDAEFADRSASANTLTFTPRMINSTFTAANSVLNGINPKPNQTTGGDHAVTGQEVQFNVNFTTPFLLPADHYFFVPQVQLPSGDFFWLSAPRPIVPPGTPFPPGSTDLQEWIRNANLDPDWLRVGTDIVGGSPAPTFNATFSLSGQTVPEPAGLMMLALGAAAVFVAARPRCRRRPAPPHRPLATPRGSDRA